MAIPALAQLNLNLLVALDSLLETQSVTATAGRLGVTQSAMSHSLRQLRELLDDPLLVRGERGLVPTPRARALRPGLRQSLASLQRSLEGAPTFDPANARRRFVVRTTDYVTTVLGPRLASDLAQRAPHVDLHLSAAPLSTQGLEEGEVDLLLMPQWPGTDQAKRRVLFDDRFACLVRAGHPRVGQRLSLKRFADLGHVLISPGGEGPGIVDRALERHGLTRRVAVRVGFFSAALRIVAETDHVLTAPKLFADRYAESAGLRVLRPPASLELGGFSIYAYWHPCMDADPGHRWLRERVASIARSS